MLQIFMVNNIQSLVINKTNITICVCTENKLVIAGVVDVDGRK